MAQGDYFWTGLCSALLVKVMRYGYVRVGDISTAFGILLLNFCGSIQRRVRESANIPRYRVGL